MSATCANPVAAADPAAPVPSSRRATVSTSASSATSASWPGLMSLLLGVLLAAVALTGVGCVSDAPSGDVAAVMAVGDYRSTSASTFTLVDGTDVQLTVGRTDLSVAAGCNTLAAPYTLDGEALVLGQVASTMIGCAVPLADQDVRLGAFLESRPVVTPSADGMTWTAGDGVTIVFVDRAVADPDRPLQGTRWTLDGVGDGESVVSAVGFDAVVVVFDNDTVTVTTGCAEGQTSYRPPVDEGTGAGGIALGSLSLVGSGDACGDDARQAGAALTEVFGGTATLRVEADILELRRGGVALTFRAG